MSKDALIVLIEQAFADTVYPEGAKITDCKWDGCWECAEIAEAFAGKHWTSVRNARFLRKYHEALPLFQPEAFRFYLPAYMIVNLKSRAYLGIMPESITFNLTPPEIKGVLAEDWFNKFGETHIDYWTRRVSGFTDAQKRVIKAYLEIWYKRNPMLWHESSQLERQRALAFWDTFEG